MTNDEKLSLLALDLTKAFPRSPRETLGGYVVAGRMLDKCRAVVAGTNGDYHFDCPLDQKFLKFAEIDAAAFKEYVASGANDDDVAQWINDHAKSRERIDVIKWNNHMRELKISDLPDAAQEFLEGYIPQFVPKNRPVYRWFDVYDLEEQRI